MQPYNPETEQAMRKYFLTLSEKDRRRYAAIEALKFKHGGRRYITGLLGCNGRTIARGIADLKELPEQPQHETGLRKLNAGRPRYDTIYPEIDTQFLRVLKEHTTDNINDQVILTDLSPDQIAALLKEHHHINVSGAVVRKLFKKHNCHRL